MEYKSEETLERELEIKAEELRKIKGELDEYLDAQREDDALEAALERSREAREHNEKELY